MGFTTNYSIPYPELTDIPDGAGQMKALATQVDSQMKAKIDTPDVTIAGTPVGITLGNGTQSHTYRYMGSHIHVVSTVTAAASAPTTAFTGGVTLALPMNAKRNVVGHAYWNPGASGAYKVGACFTVANTSVLYITAVRQTDLAYIAAGTVWGTAAWGTSAQLVASILIPI